ncbi:MAG TPA: glycosyltransferase family 4 protein, partial [Longimicrobium sp.]|nr:glycosyltransferase family 4 protein [Longimicrobium sp.]
VPVAPARSGVGVALPALAVVSLTESGDGIAYVARLLHAAFREIGGAEPRVLAVDPASAGAVSLTERGRFMARLLAESARSGSRGILFNHLGIARAQLWVPPPLRRPYAVFLNGIEAWDPELSAPRRAAVRGATARISISHYTRRRVLDAYPDAGPISACPLGLLDPPAVGRPDGDLLGRVGERSVLIVGRMSAAERYKGHDELIECWPRVLGRVPGAQLVVAGRGDDVDRLRRKAAGAGLAGHVIFPGFVSDATLEALLRRVALFAMPSRGEGFGLVYLQAMRAGLPCVGSTTDAAGDVIAHGETGLLADPADRDALADAIARLLEDAGLRARMGGAGERRFRREFTFERFRDRLAPLLAGAFGGERG